MPKKNWKIFFSRTTVHISTKLDTNNSWVKGTRVFTKYFQKGKNVFFRSQSVLGIIIASGNVFIDCICFSDELCGPLASCLSVLFISISQTTGVLWLAWSKSTEHSEFDSIVCMRSKIIEFSKCNIRLSPLLGLIMHALQS